MDFLTEGQPLKQPTICSYMLEKIIFFSAKFYIVISFKCTNQFVWGHGSQWMLATEY